MYMYIESAYYSYIAMFIFHMCVLLQYVILPPKIGGNLDTWKLNHKCVENTLLLPLLA